MPKQSAGLLMYRRTQSGAVEVFLVHPGGPFFANKDEGAWSIPKGEPAADEELLACARRELEEETGLPAPETARCMPLGSIAQSGGKLVHAWAFEGDWDGRALSSNHFELEWPPRSGRKRSFPEIDRAGFFAPEVARRKLNPAQVAFVDRLLERLAASASRP